MRFEYMTTLTQLNSIVDVVRAAASLANNMMDAAISPTATNFTIVFSQ